MLIGASSKIAWSRVNLSRMACSARSCSVMSRSLPGSAAAEPRVASISSSSRMRRRIRSFSARRASSVVVSLLILIPVRCSLECGSVEPWNASLT
jgi:hypothetical protein